MTKYRFWSTIDGKMLTVAKINFSAKTHEPISVYCVGVTPVISIDNGVLMQSAGFNDKDNKEIYEGDTVMVSSLKLMGEVYFSNGVFFITGCEATGGVAKEDRTLIGNHYENPNIHNGVFQTIPPITP
jgi:hypothetical protein